LLPAEAADGLTFTPTHPKAEEALAWMGFEARSAILEVLDQAIDDKNAQVMVIAFDLNEPEIVNRLEQLGSRLSIIIDDSPDHQEECSGENQAEERLIESAGAENVKRQHMSALQHNKTIVVDSPTIQTVVCGSTNFSWRGFYVQANNAVVLQGTDAVEVFTIAFENYWQQPKDFENTPSAEWSDLKLPQIDARIVFSPHSPANALLQMIGDDIDRHTTSSLFFSLAFLYQTKGAIREAIEKMLKNENIFVYGISDKKVGGLDLQKPDGGNPVPVFPAALSKNVPEPFSAEPTGGSGTRMHHKFVVIDFDKPTARVYLGSYNFSKAVYTENGENLLLIEDRRVAVSYVVEAVRIIDHYHFRVAQQAATEAEKTLHLKKPPRDGEPAWWDEDYQNPRKIRDRELFA
jgi:phosphatidylserine/phosphatidylglycerophosphate/cardiolipin synthase-like enzyme